MQMMVGLFQSSGWPSVVAVVGNWFGKSKRGLIMGIWNAHTSVGNISGALIAAAMLKYGWSWSFAVPGIMIVLVGLSVFLLLPIPDVIVCCSRQGSGQGREKGVAFSALRLVGQGRIVSRDGNGAIPAGDLENVLPPVCVRSPLPAPVKARGDRLSPVPD
jgi:MFS family permease